MSTAYAGQTKLSWQAPKTPPDFVAFRVYWGEKSGKYTAHKQVGSKQTEVTITGLKDEKTYYFAATTVSESGQESAYSNEVSAYLDIDSDNDGILNRQEREVYGTDPKRADTDGDGIRDLDEIKFWKDAWKQDDDGDGKINLLDSDSDNDGASDGDEIAAGTDPIDSGSKPAPPVKPEPPAPPLSRLSWNCCPSQRRKRAMPKGHTEPSKRPTETWTRAGRRKVTGSGFDSISAPSKPWVKLPSPGLPGIAARRLSPLKSPSIARPGVKFSWATAAAQQKIWRLMHSPLLRLATSAS